MGTRRRFGTVRKLPSGRYQVRYFDAAGQRQTAPVTFARKGDADAWLASVQTDLRRGDWIDPALRRITFGEWASDWRRTTVALRPSTRARDDSYLRTLILPTFGAVPIAQIDHLAVPEWNRRVVGGWTVPRHRGQGGPDHGQGHEARGGQRRDPVEPVRRRAIAPHRARGDALPRPRGGGHAGPQHR